MEMSDFRLDGKVAWVTGASYGIGFAIATALAKAGAQIIFNDLMRKNANWAAKPMKPSASMLMAMSAMSPKKNKWWSS
jgi:NAD(P)-dependent dehydrogenase (short-subunit alcohol dehydrogenase family)